MKRNIVLILMLSLFVNMIAAEVETTTQKDGSKIIFDRIKAIKTFIASDGKKVSIDLNGKTPFGVPIDDVRKSLQKDPITVDLVFNSVYSDEILSGVVKKFYDKLFVALQKKVKEKKYLGKKPLEITISYCRYGEYGFCYKKANSVIVMLVQEGKVKKQVAIETIMLRDKKESSTFIKKISKLF